MKNYRKVFENKVGIFFYGDKYEIHHIDGNRKNNDVCNLLLIPKEIHKKFHSLQNKLSFLNNKLFDIQDFTAFDLLRSVRNEVKEYEKIKKYFLCLNFHKLNTVYYGLDFRKEYIELLKHPPKLK